MGVRLRNVMKAEGLSTIRDRVQSGLFGNIFPDRRKKNFDEKRAKEALASFKKQLIREYDLDEHPRGEAVFDLAWENGEGGLLAVIDRFERIAEVIAPRLSVREARLAWVDFNDSKTLTNKQLDGVIEQIELAMPYLRARPECRMALRCTIQDLDILRGWQSERSKTRR